MKGCWNKRQETVKALEGGWYHSGDIAVGDEDGYLYIKDRMKDMYISCLLYTSPSPRDS